MGTQQLTDAVYTSSHGKTFHNVAVSEVMLADQLLKERINIAPIIKPSGGGIDMSTVMKPIRGAEELAQILRTEESSVAQVTGEGRLKYHVLEKVEHSFKLRNVSEKRKAAHDIALKTYDQAVVDIGEELEEHVIEQCRLLRDDELVEIDTVISTELNKLQNPILVRQMEHEVSIQSDAVSNVAVIIVRIVLINSFLFYCLLLNHSFPTNPNNITN